MNAPKGPNDPGGTPLSEQLRERFERTTESARRWVERAQEIARERGFAGTTLAGSHTHAGSHSSSSVHGGAGVHATGSDPLAAHRNVVSSAQVEKPEPTSMLDRENPPAGYGRPRARALPVDPNTLVLFWEWPTDHFPLKPGDVLVLQLVSTVAIEGEPVAFTQWADGVPSAGDYFFRGLPPGATHQGFVGILREGLFEPVLYTEPVETPYGEPTIEVSPVRATLLLPERVEVKTRPGLAVVLPPPEPPRILRIEGPAPAIEAIIGQPPSPAFEQVERVETPEPATFGPFVPFGPRPSEFEPRSEDEHAEGAFARTDRRFPWAPSSWRLFSPGPWPR